LDGCDGDVAAFSYEIFIPLRQFHEIPANTWKGIFAAHSKVNIIYIMGENKMDDGRSRSGNANNDTSPAPGEIVGCLPATPFPSASGSRIYEN
jgi:hypothetical protein